MKIAQPPRHTPVSIRSPGTPVVDNPLDAGADVVEALEADHRLAREGHGRVEATIGHDRRRDRTRRASS